MKKIVILALCLVGLNASAGVQVRRSMVEKTFTPGVSATAYAAGDQIGLAGASTLTGVPQDSSGFATLWGVTVIDYKKQSAALDIWFFNAAPTVASSDNAAVDVSQSELSTKFIGAVKVPAANYTTSGANASVASVANVGLPLKATSNSKLYALVVSQGTPTYGSGASSLEIKLDFGQE